MNIIQRVAQAFRAIPAPQPVTWETVFGSGRYSTTGVSVDEYSALHYSPVWAGVTTLSRDIAKLPLVFYKNLPNGGKEPFRDHRLYRILKDEPNPEMTSFKFRETMQALCLLYGNAYAEIVRNDIGQVAGLYPIVPGRVTPLRDRDSGRLRYRVANPNGGQTLLRPENVIHLSSISTDGIIGHSIVEHARESLELGMAAEKFGGAFYGNGTAIGGVVIYPQVLNPELRLNAENAINAVHQGVERAHKNLILGGGATYHKNTTAPNEAQFIETRKFQVNEVARWLTMPPHKLGDLENAHFTNIEEQEIQYYVGCVSGWLKMWEQELSRKLIPRLEYAQQSIEHNLEGVLRGDSTKRADFYAKMFSIGAFSINRILQLENQNPIGPAGDMHLVPLNMVPIEKYPEMIDAKLAADKAKAEQPKQIETPKEPDDEAVKALREAIQAATERAEQHAVRASEAEALAKTSGEHVEEWRTIAEQEREASATARADAVRHETALTAVTAERDVAITEREREAAARTEAERRAQEADAARDAALATAQENQDNAKRAAEQVAAIVAQKEDLERRGQATQSETDSVRAAVEAAQKELAARETALVDAQRALDASTAEAVAAQKRAEQLEAAIQERRDAEADRLTRVLSAHRALVSDALGRVLRPEISRARRNHPDFRVWMDAFYDIHQRAVAEALIPVAGALLAWKGSDDSPQMYADQLAAEHCAESKRQLSAALEVSETKDEFSATLDAMLTRWEMERPHKLADKVLQHEVDYIRSYR